MHLDQDEIRAVATAIAAQHKSDPDGWMEMAANIVAGVDALFHIRQVKLANAVDAVKQVRGDADAPPTPTEVPQGSNVERIRPNPNRKKAAPAKEPAPQEPAPASESDGA